MIEDRVMRSVYISVEDDTRLRQMSQELGVTKSSLVQAAIHIKLKQ